MSHTHPCSRDLTSSTSTQASSRACTRAHATQTRCTAHDSDTGSAQHGRTIILSIHQPRFKIFDMFDTLTLMSDGLIAYHGSAKDVVDFFGGIGYQCGEFNNPADYILDVISGEEKLKVNPLLCLPSSPSITQLLCALVCLSASPSLQPPSHVRTCVCTYRPYLISGHATHSGPQQGAFLVVRKRFLSTSLTIVCLNPQHV